MLRSAIVKAAVVLGAGAVALSSTACGSPDPAPGGRALAGPAPGWRTSAVFGVAKGTASISAIAAASGGDAWAAGVTDTPGAKGPKMSALLEHWAGKSWRRVRLPAPAAAEWDAALLNSVIAASAGSGLWAFDTARKGDVYAHNDGHQWVFGTLPDTGMDMKAHRALVLIAAAAAVGKHQAWAFGTTLTTAGSVLPYAAEYTGHRWVTRHVPGDGAIVSAVVSSPRDVLALVGSDEFFGFGTATPTVVRWNGRTWRPLPAQPKGLPADNEATSMAVSGGHVWIIGDYYVSIEQRAGFAAELKGSSWTITELPGSASGDNFEMTSLVPDGHSGLWGLGVSYQSAALVSQRLWHYTGGRWQKPIAPRFGGTLGELQQLAAVPGTSTIWGAGGVRHKSALDGLIAVDGPAPG